MVFEQRKDHRGVKQIDVRRGNDEFDDIQQMILNKEIKWLYNGNL